MAWTNPLDTLPQFRSDWANHIVYGGIGSSLQTAAVLLVLHGVFGHALTLSLVLHTAALSLLTMTAVAVIKKAADYIKVGAPTESGPVCIGKAIATVLWPLTVWGALAMAAGVPW
jgi:ethanolamine utilization protein EutA (predicted chaperonin)